MTKNKDELRLDGKFLRAGFHHLAKKMPGAFEVLDAVGMQGDMLTRGILDSFRLSPKLHNDKGYPVILAPGIGMQEDSMVELGDHLEAYGYHVIYPGYKARNPGPTEEYNACFVSRIIKTHEETGLPVAIVGHSESGVKAIAAAVDLPRGMVGPIVTMGSPLIHDPKKVPGPVISIWSKDDEVVRDYRDCILPDHPLFTNIEVTGGHCKMPMRKECQKAVAQGLEMGLQQMKAMRVRPSARAPKFVPEACPA